MAQQVHLIVAKGRATRWRRLQEQFIHLRQHLGPDGVVWLTAHPRQARRWQSALPTGWLIADVQQFADALVQHYEPNGRWLQPWERRWRTWQVVERCHKQLRYYDRVSRKRGFVDQLAETIRELERAGLTGSTWTHWLGQLWGQAGPLWHDLLLLFQQWEEQTSHKGEWSAERRQLLAADLWHRGQRHPWEALRAVCVVGCVELPRCTALLLESLAASGVQVWGEAPLRQDEATGEVYRGWSVLPADKVDLIELPDDPSPQRLAQIKLIEAAGALGQARCVLRQVRQWLDQGIAPEQIVLTARRIDESLAGLYSDVAEEYGVPLQVERRLPLSHCPAVAFLLLALRLPARHWQLRDVTALLRHSYFQPDWPELTSDPSVRYAAELFLRQLGIPQGRRALERAIRYWEQRANAAPPTAPADTDSIPTPITNQPTLTDHHGAPFPYPLDEETEQDNEHSRYLQALAGRCARLLYRLFEQYDTLEQHWVSATDWSDNRLAFLTEQWWEEEGADISPAAESDEPVASIHQPEGKVLLQRLQVFAAGIGLRPGLLSKEEQEALEQLWQGMAEALGQLKVHSWGYLAQVVEQTAQKMERTVSVVQPEGQVLLVEAEEAAGLPCDYLILLDLGEGSWPQSSEAGTLLQEGLRQRLRNAGMPVTTAAERVQHETLLFSHLTKSATRELILSYAAFDAAGEPLLPTALLQDWLENITPGQLTIIRQKMLLDGYWTQQPLSQAEQRIQYAHALVHEGTVDRQRYPAVTDELLRVLQRVEAMTAARWQQPCYTPYDGLIDAPAARQVLQHLFSEGCLFSSTALETYLFCPFRFLAHYVLGLHELPDPTEHIEQSRRGIVLHAALARFHQHLACLGLNPQTLLNTRTEGVAASHHSQNDTVETRADQSTPALNGLDPVVLLEQMIDEAIMAYLPVGQGRLTRELWRWEGVRLRRYAGRYWRQWLRWLTQCQRAGVVPEPAAFETPFGEHDDMCRLTTPAGTVRLGGRIDRVDRATAGEGVWIIDYKTGRGYSYSAAAVQRLERLQLPLYAWAWEQQQGPGQTIPLRGLVYWFVTGDGPKVVWPAGRGKLLRLGDTTGWEQFRHQTMQQIQAVVAAIRQGHFPLLPRDRDCTSHCPYRTICRIRQKPSHKPRCWPPLLQHQPTVTTNKLSTEPIMRESA